MRQRHAGPFFPYDCHDCLSPTTSFFFPLRLSLPYNYYDYEYVPRKNGPTDAPSLSSLLRYLRYR